jgi:membrane protease YdiL (CAAX protease family)
MTNHIRDGSANRRHLLARLLAIWFIANFALVGAASALAGRWYLGWARGLPIMLIELALIQVPNLLLPLWLLRRQGFAGLRDALGWRWAGWRTLAAGVLAFAVSLGLSAGVVAMFGNPIPYNLPGEGGGITAHNLLAVVGLLLLLLLFVGLTTAAEETMFRGLLQTRLTAAYGAPAGILMAALLFGLRHLPADLFYAAAWHATPRMWLARLIQLYGGAVLFGLARHYGRSTYASWILHALMFVVIL